MTRGRQLHCGTILGWKKLPEIPSLSNGVDAVSPPLVVVGEMHLLVCPKRF